MSKSYRGSCLCGQIRFEVDRFAAHTGHCHCSMCRKFHGAAFATIAEAKQPDFRWTSGQDLIKSFTADNGTTRGFCSNCGSSLTFASPNADPQLVEFALACLDDDVPIRPDAHIFVGSAANWVKPDDDLPRYQAGRDSQRLK